MSYKSKYTGPQIDDILDSVEGKQNEIEDLASIRSGAAKGATALQSYTEKYTGTITGIKMNGASKGTSGVVDLGTVITSHQDISGKADKSSLAAVATSGSYNDLSNKPTIPSAVTESTVSGWGFTKNTGTYSKPSGGIPKTDLTSAVQTSLGKADTALQSYTEQYQGTVQSVETSETLDEVNTTTYVKYVAQTLTDAQKAQARANIGAAAVGEGGGGTTSGGSGAYSEVNHGTSDTTFTLTPNTFHVWEEVSALTLTLGSETAGIANEYLFQFTSGATATTLTLPDDIKWTEEMVIEPRAIYQISVLKNLGSFIKCHHKSLITFFISKTKYQAEPNMTWADWCDSPYNTHGYYVQGIKIIDDMDSRISGVTPSDVIIPNHTYDTYLD